jgi:hypothetical protein
LNTAIVCRIGEACCTAACRTTTTLLRIQDWGFFFLVYRGWEVGFLRWNFLKVNWTNLCNWGFLGTYGVIVRQVLDRTILY